MGLNKDALLKIFALISIVAIILLISFHFNKEEYLFWSSIAANIIQIVLFGIWYFEDSSISFKKIEEIHEYTTREKLEDKKRMEIMARLMKEGLIPGEEIKRAFKSLKLEEVIVINPYGEGLSNNLIKEFGLEKQPLITIIQDLGFVKVFRYSHIYIIFKKSLPKHLRDLGNLEEYLIAKLEKKWNEIKEFTKEKYPENKYKIYSKIRDGTSFKCSYLLLKSLREECIMNYQKVSSFTKEFIEKVLVKYNEKKRKPSSIEVKKFILKIKSDILLGEILDKPRINKFNRNEIEIKNALGIVNFYGFKDSTIQNIGKVIDEKTGLKLSEEEIRLIKIEAEGYYNALKEMGLI